MDDSAFLETLSSAGAVIDALGGSLAAARLGRRTIAAATNWRATGRLPPHTFLIFRERLAAIGKTAPSALWGIPQPEPHNALTGT